MKKNYPTSPARKQSAITNIKAAFTRAENVYKEGWLFHGPRFQCLKDLGTVGENGIDGILKATSVPGALLDNVGQLAGCLIIQNLDVDRYAMPIRIARIEFFSDQPPEGDVECGVRFDRIRSRDLMFNMELMYKGQMWARIEGWEKWRFETDDLLWNFLLSPGKRILSEINNGNASFLRPQLSSASCDDLAKRYLREAERDVYYSLGKKKESWICGRVAAKDAIRSYLWDKGYAGDIFPAEIFIVNDESGRPIIREMPGDKKLFLSISHRDGFGIACVSETAEIGIDVELIEPREESFEKIAFSPKEIEMLPKASRSEWITRWWSAKEAYSKSKGHGLKGDPKNFQITELGEERIKVEDKWISSKRIGDYIISQTEKT